MAVFLCSFYGGDGHQKAQEIHPHTLYGQGVSLRQSPGGLCRQLSSSASATPKAPGREKPFELIDWQERIIRDLFGVVKENGYRQFNTAYIEIPKKMGKSELAAAVALLLTCGDGEERAEVYGCAADRQQASIVFEVAADMVKMCPALSSVVKILASQKRIVYHPTNSFYQVLSAEAYRSTALISTAWYSMSCTPSRTGNSLTS